MTFHDPQHWRDRAEDARRLAAEIIDPPSRRTMLDRSYGVRAAVFLRIAPASTKTIPIGAPVSYGTAGVHLRARDSAQIA
jgi:hypothetical protein